MWNKVLLSSGDEVKWRVSNNVFEVRCSVNEKVIPDGCRLYVCSREYGNIHKMCIGSFSKKNGEFFVGKSYTAAYLELNNISSGGILDFEITGSDGAVVWMSGNIAENNEYKEEKDEDFSLTRAKNLLESACGKTENFDEADLIAFNTIRNMDKYDSTTLPCFVDFEWVRIGTVEECFGLSAVSHLIYDTAFLQMFCNFKEWYFGRQGNRMFAVCMGCTHDNTPFSNAEDCSVVAKCDGVNYYAVGIALLDDGQYFYRIC